MKVKFLDFSVPVEFDSTVDGDEALGMYSRGALVVDSGLSTEDAAVTICHESIHALFDKLGWCDVPGLKDFEELIAKKIGQQFIPSLIRNNPKLIKDLQKNK